MGPCMCGDLFCSSCGPAQGNYKCVQCGAWSMDGGCENPERCAELDRQMAAAEAAFNDTEMKPEETDAF
jgi:hypothetical protein